MNYVKFNKEKLQEYLKENKKTINKIFSDEENLKKLENNNFINLYFNMDLDAYNNRLIAHSNNPLITAVLLLSDINFLPYLNKIPDYCFDNLDMIENITIPNSVTSIGSWAFNGCTSLTSITIPDSVTEIDFGVFVGCANLTSIAIPNGVISIKSSVFAYCSGLTSITIPNSVTSIGYDAFEGCSSLKSITFKGTKDEWENVDKTRYWRENSSIKEIECTDGVIKL